MRHHNANRKLGRSRDQRRALLKSLASELVVHGKITTTLAKAKELRPHFEKILTTARTGTLAARRKVASELATKAQVKRMVDEIAPRYKERTGGYTRIVKLGRRMGDASPMAVIELVEATDKK